MVKHESCQKNPKTCKNTKPKKCHCVKSVRDTVYFSVFSPNARIYGPEQPRIRVLFTQFVMPRFMHSLGDAQQRFFLKPYQHYEKLSLITLNLLSPFHEMVMGIDKSTAHFS